MRMLKLIFVDGVSPRGILVQTFTKKAAQELRSRLPSWGYAVQEHLLTKEKVSKMYRVWLERVDINQVRTGTIDSICEELLRDFRDPSTDPPTPALETFRPEEMPPGDPSAIFPDVKNGALTRLMLIGAGEMVGCVSWSRQWNRNDCHL